MNGLCQQLISSLLKLYLYNDIFIFKFLKIDLYNSYNNMLVGCNECVNNNFLLKLFFIKLIIFISRSVS